MKNITALLKGLWITVSHLFKKPVTVQYPTQRPPISPRFRGMVVYIYDSEKGRDRCTGCGVCQAECPEKAIYVTKTKVDETDPESGETKSVPRPDVYKLNHNTCVFCGICVEVCPFDALAMIGEYELAAYEKVDLIRDKRDMLSHALPKLTKPWLEVSSGN